MRASHDDREQVVERLREAAIEGRLDPDELDTRLGQALTAKTLSDLAPLTADLAPVVPPSARTPLSLDGGIHGVKREGRWQVPERITVYGGMGGARLDFTRTGCRLREIAVEAHGQMAGVVIIIPDGWAADVDRFDQGLGGLKDKTTPDTTAGAPLLRLSGTGGMAGVVIRHPNNRERRKLRKEES
ncbi:uncharacterized protein DUF1707 [Murinocardiopsis flavida]|uniref:Uncharacterized protein DUF1707 n=1 Tax=Murinocardiopsis flavida TaxID=645275 RepID=A0A2P8DNU7_9ACTN|nr:uncharacterized protein DUF1707 [Murinocardiopsis flavida]